MIVVEEYLTIAWTVLEVVGHAGGVHRFGGDGFGVEGHDVVAAVGLRGISVW